MEFHLRVTRLRFSSNSFTVSAVLAGAMLTSCRSSSDSDSKVVKTEDGKELQVLRAAIMTGQGDQYADYIGTEEGIFEKYGISLETAEFAKGINTVDSIVAGTSDTGLLADFAAVNSFGNTLHDTNLVIFSDLSSGGSTTGGLYVAPEYADDLSKLDDINTWAISQGKYEEEYNVRQFYYTAAAEKALPNKVTVDLSSVK
jgi:ABC-type nitrate/sulfonate/bicarbonate transport system substrate-binding protein